MFQSRGATTEKAPSPQSRLGDLKVPTLLKTKALKSQINKVQRGHYELFHLDVSVRNVDVVEEADGRADVPHDLRRLWEEETGEGTLSNQRRQ